MYSELYEYTGIVISSEAGMQESVSGPSADSEGGWVAGFRPEGGGVELQGFGREAPETLCPAPKAPV